ncbi:uncharacterized protein [Periplaneta americana]|uniref:uncharacterized protein n=1 Tax=Periplaneta americana TaxID=6978 RepID=UPI0037E77B87
MSGVEDLYFFLKLSRENSSKDTVKYCQEHGLLASHYKCPTCGKSMKLRDRSELSDGVQWHCTGKGSDNAHRVSRSVRTGTWFSTSRLTMSKLLLLTYCWFTKVPQQNAKECAQVDKNTVLQWYLYCREACGVIVETFKGKLGGTGHTVEIDEFKFGKMKYHKGKLVEGRWVLAAVDRETRECLLLPVHDRSKDVLLQIIKDRIVPGTTIYSDCWKSYNTLNDEEFKQLTLDHSIRFKNPQTRAHTNRIKGVWAHAKRSMPTTNVEKGAMFDSYLSAFMYRQWRGPNHTFHSFLQDIAKVYKPNVSD